MAMDREQSATIDEYISTFPSDVGKILENMRSVISKAAPGAEEAIRYGMPTFRLHNKNLVHFAAFRHHVGFYPTSSGIAAFNQDLSPYRQGKGSVRFPLGQPVPWDLVKKIVMFRVAETEREIKRGH